MNASNSSVIPIFAKSTSEDCISTTFQENWIVLKFFFMFSLIPEYHLYEVLRWTRRKYGYYAHKIIIMTLALIFCVPYCADDLIKTSAIMVSSLLICIGCAIAEFYFPEWVNHVDNQDENVENDTDFGRYPNLRALFRVSSALWIALNFDPLTLLNHEPRNLWNEMFDGGLKWSALVLLLTYHAFDLAQTNIYGRLLCRSSIRLLPIAFLVLIANDHIRNSDAETREQMTYMYFLIYLSLFSTSIYDILKIAYIRPHPHLNIQRIEQFKAVWLCFKLMTISSALLSFGGFLIYSCFTRFLTPYLLVLACNVVHLFSTFFTDARAYLPVRPHLVLNRRTRNLLTYLYNFFLHLLYVAVLVWMYVYQSRTWVPVFTMVAFIGFILNNIWNILRLKFQPAICVRFFPRADAEQLALNDNVCIVCHEEMESACITPCNHLYHPKCLLAWLNIKNKCPLCQRVLYVNSQ